jgi:hypothetical protein
MNINIRSSGRKQEVRKISWPENRECILMLVKVGNENRPATDEDIDDITKNLSEAIEQSKKDGGPICLVTHHAVVVETHYIHVPEWQDHCGKNK